MNLIQLFINFVFMGIGTICIMYSTKVDGWKYVILITIGIFFIRFGLIYF